MSWVGGWAEWLLRTVGVGVVVVVVLGGVWWAVSTLSCHSPGCGFWVQVPWLTALGPVHVMMMWPLVL